MPAQSPSYRQAPQVFFLEPGDRPCCAACIRGTKALQGPCGRPECKCHTKKETK